MCSAVLKIVVSAKRESLVASRLMELLAASFDWDASLRGLAGCLWAVADPLCESSSDSH